MNTFFGVLDSRVVDRHSMPTMHAALARGTGRPPPIFPRESQSYLLSPPPNIGQRTVCSFGNAPISQTSVDRRRPPPAIAHRPRPAELTNPRRVPSNVRYRNPSYGMSGSMMAMMDEEREKTTYRPPAMRQPDNVPRFETVNLMSPPPSVQRFTLRAAPTQPPSSPGPPPPKIRPELVAVYPQFMHPRGAIRQPFRFGFNGRLRPPPPPPTDANGHPQFTRPCLQQLLQLQQKRCPDEDTLPNALALYTLTKLTWLPVFRLTGDARVVVQAQYVDNEHSAVVHGTRLARQLYAQLNLWRDVQVPLHGTGADADGIGDPYLRRIAGTYTLGVPPTSISTASMAQSFVGACQRMASADPMPDITAQLLATYTRSCVRLTQVHRMLRARAHLQRRVQSIFKESELYMIGSALTGFGCDDSDLDLCLLLDASITIPADGNCVSSAPKIPAPRTNTKAITALELLQRTLNQVHPDEIDGTVLEFAPVRLIDIQLIRARVPILRMTACGRDPAELIDGDEAHDDDEWQLQVDVNVDNVVAVHNTRLLWYYGMGESTIVNAVLFCAVDPRVRPFVVGVKQWARAQGINDSRQARLSSYSLALMAIHYLQIGCSPSVAPCVQQQNAAFFSASSQSAANVLCGAPIRIDLQHMNTMSLGELLIGFMHYYAYVFTFDAQAICVREGVRQQQHLCADKLQQQWSALCIEEPFTRDNVAASTFDCHQFATRVLSGIKHAHGVLLTKREYTPLLVKTTMPTNQMVMAKSQMANQQLTHAMYGPRQAPPSCLPWQLTLRPRPRPLLILPSPPPPLCLPSAKFAFMTDPTSSTSPESCCTRTSSDEEHTTPPSFHLDPQAFPSVQESCLMTATPPPAATKTDERRGRNKLKTRVSLFSLLPSDCSTQESPSAKVESPLSAPALVRILHHTSFEIFVHEPTLPSVGLRRLSGQRRQPHAMARRSWRPLDGGASKKTEVVIEKKTATSPVTEKTAVEKKKKRRRGR